jgi:glycosyltransferase involved in cell wall biosynthesis
LLWQPGFDLARGSDLIITEQASKQLFNIVLAYSQRGLRTRHAFWGHGRNFQQSVEGGSGEGLKRRLTARAHWFFAYNDLSASAAVEAGMPPERVTPVMNSTDTERIHTFRDSLADDAHSQIRSEHGFGHGPLALFMGGIYAPKRPEFLIASAKEVRRLIPDFELVVIGDGTSRNTVREAAEEHDWIHWLGAQYGDARLAPASVCSVQMMPGLVGLNIVDAFALGLPTITTDVDWHSPEIDYLEDGKNGVLVAGDATPADFAAAVAGVLNNDVRLRMLREGADASGRRLSIQDMAHRFHSGVVAALEAPSRS